MLFVRAFCEVWSMQSKGLEIGEKLWRSDEKYTQIVLGWFLLKERQMDNVERKVVVVEVICSESLSLSTCLWI